MKLKLKFVSLVSLVFLATLLASYGMFAFLREEIISGLGSDFARIRVLYNRSRATEPLLREIALARKMADSSAIKDWAKDEKNPGKKTAAIRELEQYRRYFSDGSWFFAMAGSGNYYFGDRQSAGRTETPRYTLDPENVENRWFYGTLESGAPYLINVDHDEKLGLTKVWVNVVVRNGLTPLGVIGTGIDLTTFIKAAVAPDDPGVESLFINSQGAIQAHAKTSEIDYRSISKDPSDQRTIFGLIDEEPDREKLKKAMSDLKDGGTNEVSTLVVHSNGMETLLGLAFIKETGWYNISFLETENIIGTHRFLPFAILLGAALLTLSVSIVYVLDRYVLRRIALLDKATVRLAGGRLENGEKAKPEDELDGLEESFRLMSEKVRRHTAELETKVERDTVEIAEKTNRLEETSRELKVLKGLLPTCMYCKKIRDETGRWNSLEEYLTTHSEAKLSHGCCPDCLDRAYRDAGLVNKHK